APIFEGGALTFASGAVEWPLDVPEGSELALGGSGRAVVRWGTEDERASAPAEAGHGWTDVAPSTGEASLRWQELGRGELPIRANLRRGFGVLRLEFEGEGSLTDARVLRGAPLAAFEAGPATRPTNVLVFLVDTVRADKLRPFNESTRVRTPGLDRWSQSAGVFRAARTQENWTKPSVATLLSGLFPWQHTAASGEAVLPDSVEILSERLREEGFATAAFVCNGYVSDAFGFRQGWGSFRNYLREGRRTQARFVAADVLEWLDGRDEEKPFFLYVHTIDPHVPYLPPPELLAEYDPDPYSGPVDFGRDRLLLEKIKSGRLRTNARDRRRLEALYDGEITYHDVHFASILEGLQRRGLAENTMVVFTSDHGEEFFDHGSVGHGHSLYEELLHVPLLVKVPGLEGRAIDAPAGLLDVVPTVYDALGLRASRSLPGRSLLPDLRGEPGTPRAMVAGFMEGWRSVVLGRFKLVHRTHRRVAVFDLEADPEETTNLAEGRPELVRYLRASLGLSLRGPVEHTRQRRTIDAELEAQLEQLGYVGAERPRD
ncbi:MAG: sulfatase, partial [Myxococcota bacterium]